MPSQPSGEWPQLAEVAKSIRQVLLSISYIEGLQLLEFNFNLNLKLNLDHTLLNSSATSHPSMSFSRPTEAQDHICYILLQQVRIPTVYAKDYGRGID